MIQERQHDGAAPVIDGALARSFMLVMRDEEHNAGRHGLTCGLDSRKRAEQVFAFRKGLIAKLGSFALEVRKGLFELRET